MSVNSVIQPFLQIPDGNGNPLESGNVYIGTAGLDPKTNAIQVYSDVALSVTVAQPIKTAGGYPVVNANPIKVYVNAADFSITVEDKNNVQVYTESNAAQKVDSSNLSGLNATDIIYTPSGTGVDTTLTVEDRLREKVDLTDFSGFVGDGSNDDTAAFNNAVAEALSSGKALTCGAGFTIKLTASVDLVGIRTIQFLSDILLTTGTMTIGGFGEIGHMFVSLRNVTNGNSPIGAAPPASPVLRIAGMRDSTFNVGSCNYIQLWADASVAGLAAGKRLVAYNSMTFEGATSLLELTDSGDSSGGSGAPFVNENWLYANRCVRYKIIAVGNAHNHNKLINPTFETSSVEIEYSGTVTDIGPSVNTITGARFENTGSATGITLAAGTYSNTILGSWSGTGNPRQQFAPLNIPVSDSGMGNMVATEASTQFRKTNIFSIGPNSHIVANATDSTAASPRVSPDTSGVDNVVAKVVLKPHLTGASSVNAFRYLALSDMIPVQLGDVIVWDANYTNSNMARAIFVYDADMSPLTTEGAGGEYVDLSGATYTGTYGRYSLGSGQAESLVIANPSAIVRSEVKYIRVGVFTDANAFVFYFGASLYTQTTDRGESEGAATDRMLARELVGAPTQGYVPVGYSVFDPTPGLRTTRRVTYAWNTLVNGALAAAATSVTVDAIDTVADGDIVGIMLDNFTTHWTSVSALAGSTFTIDAIPAGRSVNDNARIVFNRWRDDILNAVLVQTITPALADGAAFSVSVPVTGAALSDFAIASYSTDIQGLIQTAYVNVANNVRVRWQNETGAPQTVVGGSVRVKVIKNT